MMKTGVKIVVVLLAVFLSLSGCAPHKKQTGVTLRIGYIAQSGRKMTGPEGWAIRNGEMLKSLRPLGITRIETTGFPNGPDASIALASNAIDIASLGDFPAIIAHGAGLPTRLIAITSGGGGRKQKSGSNTSIMVLPGGPKSVDELLGKRIGVARGSNMERFLLGVLDLKKITKSVHIIHIPAADQEAAIRGKAVDAICASYSSLMASRGLHSLASADQYPQLAGVGVTVANESFLKAHPGFPKLWNGSKRAWHDDLIAHQDEYFKFAAANAKLPVEMYRATYPLALFVPEPFTTDGLKRLDGTKAFALRLKILEHDFSIKDWRADNDR